MTNADLVTIDQRIQRAGAANCWTGTLGSLAADARRLVRHIQETRKMSCEYPVDHILQGERELRQHPGDEMEPEATVIEEPEEDQPYSTVDPLTKQINDLEAKLAAGPPEETPAWATPIAEKIVEYLHDSGPPVAVRLLETAKAAVLDRHRVYGPPQEHFARTVGMVNSLFASVLKRPLTTSDWARIMLLDKLARDLGPRPHPDNVVDLAGYAACLAECNASSPPADGGT